MFMFEMRGLKTAKRCHFRGLKTPKSTRNYYCFVMEMLILSWIKCPYIVNMHPCTETNSKLQKLDLCGPVCMLDRSRCTLLLCWKDSCFTFYLTISFVIKDLLTYTPSKYLTRCEKHSEPWGQNMRIVFWKFECLQEHTLKITGVIVLDFFVVKNKLLRFNIMV